MGGANCPCVPALLDVIEATAAYHNAVKEWHLSQVLSHTDWQKFAALNVADADLPSCLKRPRCRAESEGNASRIAVVGSGIENEAGFLIRLSGPEQESAFPLLKTLIHPPCMVIRDG